MVAVNKLLAALGTVVLERLPDGLFSVQGELPQWCGQLRREDRLPWGSPFSVEDVFPFLSVFLPEAENAWRAVAPGPAQSDMWTEVDASGHEVHLEATALRVEQTCVLMITRNDRLFLEHETLLQRARELRLTHGSLMKEIEHKEILVHAIVHDLAAPLHSIMGVLSLVSEQPLDEPSAKWIRLATQAAARQRELITEILDVFAAEDGQFAPRATDGVDLVEVVEHVLAELGPVARKRNIQLRSHLKEQLSSQHVRADETRLFRVLTNLLANAFRYGPVGGTVGLTARRENGTVVICVDDDGPGVSSELLPRLFEKFGRGRESGAGTGLGLFYCRITVENWGGGIGYEPREGGGARFWIRLRTLPTTDVQHPPNEGTACDGEALAAR